MRHALLVPILFLSSAGCASVRNMASDFRASLPSVLVYEEDAGGRTALIVAREVLDGWNFLFLNITETEFALCLEGRNEGGRLTITGFRLAHILSSHSSAVQYVPCNSPNYVGTAHNHLQSDYPGQDPCYQSEKDLHSFKKDGKAVIDIVICGRDRFVWDLKDGRAPRVWASGATSAGRK